MSCLMRPFLPRLGPPFLAARVKIRSQLQCFRAPPFIVRRSSTRALTMLTVMIRSQVTMPEVAAAAFLTQIPVALQMPPSQPETDAVPVPQRIICMLMRSHVNSLRVLDAACWVIDEYALYRYAVDLPSVSKQHSFLACWYQQACTDLVLHSDFILYYLYVSCCVSRRPVLLNMLPVCIFIALCRRTELLPTPVVSQYSPTRTAELWDAGIPLAVVTALRTNRNSKRGQLAVCRAITALCNGGKLRCRTSISPLNEAIPILIAAQEMFVPFGSDRLLIDSALGYLKGWRPPSPP